MFSGTLFGQPLELRGVAGIEEVDPRICASSEEELKQLCQQLKIPVTEEWLVVSIADQKMLCCLGGYRFTCMVSTGKNGVSQKEGSGGTPLGLHQVVEIYGDEQVSEGTVFRERKNTGILVKNTPDI